MRKFKVLREREKRAKEEAPKTENVVVRPSRRKRRRAGDTLHEKDPW